MQELCFGGRGFLLCDDILDPALKVANLGLQPGLEILIHAFDIGRNALLPSRTCNF
jgi:hypothetical protein